MREVHRPPVARLVTQFFNEQEAALLAQVKSVKFLASFFSFDRWRNRFLELLIARIRAILMDGMLAGTMRANLEEELSREDLERRNVQMDIVARQVARSELVNQETEKDLTDMLRGMIEENATLEEMRRAMRLRFDGYRRFRVDRITNTVVVGAFESGTLLSWQDAGIERKAWLSGKDDRVRDTHEDANGQIVDMNTPFRVGEAQLMHPGDPDGPPGEVINCRCTMVPVTPGDEDLVREAAQVERV